MDLSVHTLFFSPTGGTRKAASLFAHSFSSHVEEHSLEQPVTGFLLMISLLSHFLFLPDGFLLMHEKNSKQ